MAHRDSSTTATGQGEIKIPQSQWWADRALRSYHRLYYLVLIAWLLLPTTKQGPLSHKTTGKRLMRSKIDIYCLYMPCVHFLELYDTNWLTARLLSAV